MTFGDRAAKTPRQGPTERSRGSAERSPRTQARKRFRVLKGRQKSEATHRVGSYLTLLALLQGAPW